MYEFRQSFAERQDLQDPLKAYREQFCWPTHQGQRKLYFTGNSLGLQPANARKLILEELDDWARWGVDGHLEARRPWLRYHELFSESLARLVGALPGEVVAMNGLTANLHLLMASFFRPKGRRCKILCESKAFPSDRYALLSQLRFHGLDASHLIEVPIDAQTQGIDEAQVSAIIREQGEDIALMLMGGVNYYTGQWFDMASLTAQARQAGITVGWDLAHAAGNVPLSLHDWEVDFAAWCSYKYLNGGPGAVAGAFVHQRHHGDATIPRFEGWWGHRKDNRFAMPPDFEPIPTAEAWQLSNAPVLSMTPLLASLELFDEAGMAALRQKSLQLAGYLEYVIDEVAAASAAPLQIFTPRAAARRGCQVSLDAGAQGKALFAYLTEHGVVADWREPSVIRLAPVPLYNNYEDIYSLGILMREFYQKNAN